MAWSSQSRPEWSFNHWQLLSQQNTTTTLLLHHNHDCQNCHHRRRRPSRPQNGDIILIIKRLAAFAGSDSVNKTRKDEEAAQSFVFYHHNHRYDHHNHNHNHMIIISLINLINWSMIIINNRKTRKEERIVQTFLHFPKTIIICISTLGQWTGWLYHLEAGSDFWHFRHNIITMPMTKQTMSWKFGCLCLFNWLNTVLAQVAHRCVCSKNVPHDPPGDYIVSSSSIKSSGIFMTQCCQFVSTLWSWSPWW